MDSIPSLALETCIVLMNQKLSILTYWIWWTVISFWRMLRTPSNLNLLANCTLRIPILTSTTPMASWTKLFCSGSRPWRIESESLMVTYTTVLLTRKIPGAVMMLSRAHWTFSHWWTPGKSWRTWLKRRSTPYFWELSRNLVSGRRSRTISIEPISRMLRTANLGVHEGSSKDHLEDKKQRK